MKLAFDAYGLCTGVSTDPNEAHKQLIAEVLKRMGEGCVPQGGVSHVIAPTSPNATHIFTQAIVRPVDE